MKNKIFVGFVVIFLVLSLSIVTTSLMYNGERVGEIHHLGNITWYSSVEDMVCYKLKIDNPNCPKYYLNIRYGN